MSAALNSFYLQGTNIHYYTHVPHLVQQRKNRNFICAAALNLKLEGNVSLIALDYQIEEYEIAVLACQKKQIHVGGGVVRTQLIRASESPVTK